VLRRPGDQVTYVNEARVEGDASLDELFVGHRQARSMRLPGWAPYSQRLDESCELLTLEYLNPDDVEISYHGVTAGSALLHQCRVDEARP
jgi:hypothetical protein